MKKELRNKILYGIGGIVFLFGGYKLFKAIKTKNQNSVDAGGTSGTGENKQEDKSTGIKIGDTLVPKGNYVVIRTEPKVNDSSIHNPSGKASWYDVNDNIIDEHYTGTIGAVSGITTGTEDGLTWFKVKLIKPIKADLLTHEYGYVRGDVVKMVIENI